MKLTFNIKSVLIVSILLILFAPTEVFAQDDRIEPPKRASKIKSADDFVVRSFKLYDKVYTYNALTTKGQEIPEELEDQMVNEAKSDLDALLELAPDVADDVANASILKQARALSNFKKAKKALTYCGKIIKDMVLGSEED